MVNERIPKELLDYDLKPWCEATPGGPGPAVAEGQLLRSWNRWKVASQAQGARKAEHRAKEDHSSTVRFGLRETWPIVSSLPRLLFGMGLSVLRLSHRCVLEMRNVSNFTCS